jgi:hypothetical protein
MAAPLDDRSLTTNLMRGIGHASASCWAAAKWRCAAGGIAVDAEWWSFEVAPGRDVAVMVKGALLAAFGKCMR